MPVYLKLPLFIVCKTHDFNTHVFQTFLLGFIPLLTIRKVVNGAVNINGCCLRVIVEIHDRMTIFNPELRV